MKMPIKQIKALQGFMNKYGIYQHGKLASPDLEHPHSSDDQARLLQVQCRFKDYLDANWFKNKLPETLLEFASKASRTDGLFNNYRNHETGKFIEEAPGKLHDVFGRWMWALAELAASEQKLSGEAEQLFNEKLEVMSDVIVPLAGVHGFAFSINALSKRLEHLHSQGNLAVKETKRLNNLTYFLSALYKMNKARELDNWSWPEDKITYCSGRIPQALLSSSDVLFSPSYAKAGLEMLNFLINKSFQNNMFWPAGNLPEFYLRGCQKPLYYQQTCEAIVAEALQKAHKKTSNNLYLERIKDIVGWFEKGKNSRDVKLLSPEGGVYDAITDTEKLVNENQGAESRLTYLLVKSIELESQQDF